MLLCLLISTCKKFPEDEFISLRRVKGRLEGAWKFEYIKINNQNLTLSFTDSLNYPIEDIKIAFAFERDNGYKFQKVNDVTFTTQCPNCINVGRLFFSLDKRYFNKKSYIYFTLNSNENSLTRLFMNISSAEILTLYNKKMTLKTSNYEVRLSKIKG